MGAECGPIGDGCGGILECGACTAPETCGGAGQPSVCGLPQSGPPGPDCGNGDLDANEVCDDGNQLPDDGCAANCLAIEPGYRCPTPGSPCESTVVCGDGLLGGAETCDDRNALPGDGCDEDCRLEPGWSCPVVGAACQAARCGDGLVVGFEECDDGNTRDGDGCSAACTIEPGFTCSEASSDPVLPIVYRDFIGTAGTNNNSPVDANAGPVHRDFEKYNSCRPVVEDVLGTNGKPVLDERGNCVESASSFAQWYESEEGVNRTVVGEITLAPVPGQPGTFELFDDDFFPLDGLGWNDPSAPCDGELCEHARTNGHNFHFTSEVRYWFTFRGGERLTFDGDDDVWVFIDGKLAVDISGVHSAVQRWIQLPDPDGIDPDAPADGARSDTTNVTYPPSLGLQTGRIYEVAVFQAERHTTASQYRLTLRNFLSARSSCESECGDGIATRFEVCDDGLANNTGEYGRCDPDCLGRGPRGILPRVVDRAA